jgi:23S rRNA C2498 (ribose-2'-O)-methylase RlmM
MSDGTGGTESANDRMSTILRSKWCDNIVINVRVPMEDKINNGNIIYDKLKCVLDHFPVYHMNILSDFNTK